MFWHVRLVLLLLNLIAGLPRQTDSEISEWRTGECKSNSDHNTPWSLLIAASGLSERLGFFALTSDAPVKGSDRGIYKVTDGMLLRVWRESVWTWGNFVQIRGILFFLHPRIQYKSDQWYKPVTEIRPAVIRPFSWLIGISTQWHCTISLFMSSLKYYQTWPTWPQNAFDRATDPDSDERWVESDLPGREGKLLGLLGQAWVFGNI